MQFFSVCLKSHRNLRSTIICDSAVVNLVISSSPQSSLHYHHNHCPILWTLWWWWVHCLMTREELLINKQVPHIVKRIRKIVVSVELCKEIKKDVFLSCREWKFPWGIKPQTFGFCALTLYHCLPLNHRDFMVSKAHFKVHISCLKLILSKSNTCLFRTS